MRGGACRRESLPPRARQAQEKSQAHQLAKIPIIAPLTLLKDNFSLGIRKGAINIVSSDVFAFKIEANP